MHRLTQKIRHGEFEYVSTGLGSNNPYAIDKLGRLEDIEEQLGCTLEELISGLMEKQSILRYFDKHDANINHCEVGWYVNMIMWGWMPLKDFINSLDRKNK